MSAPEFSVIVPVYNAAATLRGCVASVLAQTDATLELLLVDDGSTDGSGALCDELAAAHPVIRAMHRPNGGAAAARGTGLAAAAGRYIHFVDADDTLRPGVYAAARAAFVGGARLYWFGVDFGPDAPGWPLPAGRVERLAELAPQLETLAVDTGALAVLYNKIYPAAALDGLRFDESLAVNEDLLFNLQVLARHEKCEPVEFCSEKYYVYTATPGSLSRRARTDLLDAEAATRAAFVDFLAALGLSEAERNRLLCARQCNVACAQYHLLTGQPGVLPFGQRRALLRQTLAVPGACAALLAEARADENRLLALPYRVCLRHGWPGALAAYCGIKQRFL